ncbi:putative type II DNA modification methyl transferase [Aureococcus anophagefferens virus]|uniref:Putative type II DNA modification methyl transferase n=1 Tax=Aureococcus anophagefferens virus TaxID=1474867 RepID=A0A076FFV0_9VIRU|nr:putative type II DNA modification methyl transferase [Aureococcus anophagefferens virus]AII17159.1 putative type II DNA modification methyl transferase [Aureococcus anophagefferens virus]UOG94411.1 methyltransferase [Aureococcus anophagefferens virus]
MVELDKFYTKPHIALECFNQLKEIIGEVIIQYTFLEPSAGSGSFFNILPEDNRIGIDLKPECENVIEMNFYDYIPENVNRPIITIGNPPFGRVSSDAVKFFNHSSRFSNYIAFIIPRTFKRVSLQNKLCLDFHLIYSKDLPKNCFEPNMDAKCCFQIWKKMEVKRNKIIYDTVHPDFELVAYGKKDSRNLPTVPKNCDFAMKAFGSNCGEITKNTSKLRAKSFHFIKSKIDIEELIKRFKSLDYSIASDTVRQDSLGKGDLIYLYKEKYG